uniref:Replication factor A C-terminal domain-containing protein n=1 Tax=Magallana gigas TaxID=29159 RepID=K1REA1_MAGGI
MITDSPDIEIKDEDKEKVYDDLDFAEETQATKQIVLTDFTECDIYNCCDMPPCRRKKIKDGKCPICAKESNESSKSYKIQFLYEVDGKWDNKITLFQGTIEKVLRQTIEFQTKDELIVQVVEKLPIRFTAAISNNNFVNVSI